MTYTPDAQASIDAIGKINSMIVVILIPIAMFIYLKPLEAKRYDIVLAALALFMADLTNELVNKIWCRVSEYAPLWGTPKACWHLMEGWSYEIAFMFLVAGIPFAYYSDILPYGNKSNQFPKRFGLYPNQWFLAVGGSLMAIAVEHLLNREGYLTWDYMNWGTGSFLGFILLFFFGYFWFLVECFLVQNFSQVPPQEDAPTTTTMQSLKIGSLIVGIHAGINLIIIIVVASLGWL